MVEGGASGWFGHLKSGCCGWAILHSPEEMLVTAVGAAESWGREQILGVLRVQLLLPAP